MLIVIWLLFNKIILLNHKIILCIFKGGKSRRGWRSGGSRGSWWRSGGGSGRGGDTIINSESLDLEHFPALTTAIDAKKDNRRKKVGVQRFSASQPSLRLHHEPIHNDAATDHCVYCNLNCSETDSVVCDACEHSYHLICCGLDDKSMKFDAVRSFTTFMGWECKACRDDNRKEMKALLVEVQKLRDSHSSATVHDAAPADLDPSDNVLTAKPMLVGNVSMPSESSSHRGTSILYTDVLKIVNRSIKDVTFRKKNVIVSGLMETNNSTNEALFLNLCEDHLRVKPQLEPNATRHLG